MRRFLCFAAAFVLFASTASALVGVAGFNSTFGTPPVPGRFDFPFDTGLPGPPVLPPTFTGNQTWTPAGGAPVPLGNDEFPIIALWDGGRIHHFTIFRHPTIPNLTLITYHDDVNGNGTVDPGEGVQQITVLN